MLVKRHLESLSCALIVKHIMRPIMFMPRIASSVFILTIASMVIVGCSQQSNKGAMSSQEIAYNQSNGSVQRLDGNVSSQDVSNDSENGMPWPDEPSVTVLSWAQSIVPPKPPKDEVEENHAQPTQLIQTNVKTAKKSQNPAHSIIFHENNSQLDDDAMTAIQEIANLYKNGDVSIVMVSGYASQSPNSCACREDDINVSMRRSLAIAKALNEMGVPLSAMIVSAHRKESLDSNEGQIKNVDISIKLKDSADKKSK